MPVNVLLQTPAIAVTNTVTGRLVTTWKGVGNAKTIEIFLARAQPRAGPYLKDFGREVPKKRESRSDVHYD
jgi:hypothetical protein